MANPYQVVGEFVDDDYSRKLEEEARKRDKGIYPRTIFVGLGGTGAKALLHLRRMLLERYGAVDALDGTAFLSIDTDVRSKEVSAEEERRSPLDRALSFDKDERVDVKIEFKNYVGPNLIHHPQIREWWDERALPSEDFQIEAGAGQIRPLSRLAFFTNHELIASGLDRAHRKVTSNRLDSGRLDTSSPVRVVIVAGLAGGTGSGMVLDVAALVRRTLGSTSKPKIEGFLVLPGGFKNVEQGQSYPKLAANGCAALLELNHYLTHPFLARWQPNEVAQEVRGLYDRYVLISGTNASGQYLGDLNDCYRTLGEILFLDFGAGPMAGWVQGVRVNREQYLRSAVTYTYRLQRSDGSTQETHTDEWRNAFATVGLSKLVFPSWRLLNRCKYDLAGLMVGLMDPGRVGGLKDVITHHRDRFCFESGFFQGDRETDAGRRRHWQIRDRLARQSGAGGHVSDVYQHLRRFQEEINGLAENMYTDKATVELGEDVFKRVASLWGDPNSPGSEGDWVRRIRQNRKELIDEVHTALPKVIEDFRRRPAVGISGVMAILRDLLELLDRPADQAFYGDYFKQQQEKLRGRADIELQNWHKRLKNADRASRGFGSAVDTHEAAVQRASEAFYDYWRAEANELICGEGKRAVDGIRDVLRDQLGNLERIAERMFLLESEYQRLAEFYAQPQESSVIVEIDVPGEMGDLLEPYLGRARETKIERLQLVLDRALRRMGLDTLQRIGDKLNAEFEDFRDELAAQAFYALRGDKGRTAAFVEDPEDAVDGFIERHSLCAVLGKYYDRPKRRDLFEQLYEKGLPWGSKNQADELVNLHQPHGDAFIGCTTTGQPHEEEVVQELVDFLQQYADAPFEPRRVQAYEPCELIFYSELNAFPVYYLSEVSELRKHYDSLVARDTPLHIHQDYHQFQPILPYSTQQLPTFQVAWRLFIQALMLGLVCSVRLRPDDDQRMVYQWRRRVGPFEVQWRDLGPEGRVIDRLMSDTVLVQQLRTEVEAALKRLLQTERGGWAHLVALADYYYYCIFPVQVAPGLGRDEGTAVGSMQNLVCDHLRGEWRRQVTSQASLGPEAALAVKALLEDLHSWTEPTYRDTSQLVATTAKVPDTHRLEEWTLQGAVETEIGKLQTAGVVPRGRDAQGNPEVRFPRLAIRWDAFAAQQDAEQGAEQEPVADSDAPPPLRAEDEPPPLTAGTLYHYACDGERRGKLSAADVAARIQAAPASEHKVWTRSFGDQWHHAEEVAEIVALLDDEPPPLG